MVSKEGFPKGNSRGRCDKGNFMGIIEEGSPFFFVFPLQKNPFLGNKQGIPLGVFVEEEKQGNFRGIIEV